MAVPGFPWVLAVKSRGRTINPVTGLSCSLSRQGCGQNPQGGKAGAQKHSWSWKENPELLQGRLSPATPPCSSQGPVLLSKFPPLGLNNTRPLTNPATVTNSVGTQKDVSKWVTGKPLAAGKPSWAQGGTSQAAASSQSIALAGGGSLRTHGLSRLLRVEHRRMGLGDRPSSC